MLYVEPMKTTTPDAPIKLPFKENGQAFFFFCVSGARVTWVRESNIAIIATVMRPNAVDTE